MTKWIITIQDTHVRIENFYIGGGYGTYFVDLYKVSPQNLEKFKSNQVDQELRDFVYSTVEYED